MPREIRRTKIVATLGPAWERPEQIQAMLDAGVDVVRINASHGTAESRAEWIKRLREVQSRRDKASAILVDLHGPRIRVGNLPEPRKLEFGESIVFAPEGTADEDDIPTTYRDLAADVRPGSRILLNDGLLAVDVTGVVGDKVRGRGPLRGHAQIQQGHEPAGRRSQRPRLTPEDREEVAPGRSSSGSTTSAYQLRPSTAGHRGTPPAGARERPLVRQDREGHRPRPPRRDPRGRRRASWWRAATSGWSCRSSRCRWCRRS